MLNAKKCLLSAIICGTAFSATATPISTDIITLMDESGSMGGEQAWFSGMITGLDSSLAAAAGSDPYSAQFGVVGFGGNYVNYTTTFTRSFDMNTSTAPFDEWGTSSQASSANFVTSGGYEDGYEAIDTALGYSLRGDAVTNLLLVTDEDRDGTYSPTLTYNSTLAALTAENALLNAVLDIDIKCSDNTTALGMDYSGIGYKADGSGGFSTCELAQVISGFGTTIDDYVELAFATGGAVWDLNQLRLGGVTATSFTAAFIDVKVQETIDRDPQGTPIPEPSSLALFGLGALLLGSSRRRKARG